MYPMKHSGTEVDKVYFISGPQKWRSPQGPSSHYKSEPKSPCKLGKTLVKET